MSESLGESQTEWDEAYYASRGLAAEFVIAPNPKVAKALIGMIGNDELLLLGALDVPLNFIEYLRAFTRTVVVVDEDDEKRRRFTNHFD